MLRAWGLEADTWKGPAWLGGSVEEGYAIDATMPPSTTPEEFCGMLRNLLAERFHFTFHFEKQTRAGYELSVLPGGQKFREFVPGSASPGDGNGNDADVDPMAAQRARGSDADGFPILSPSQQTAAVWHGSRSGATKESFRNTMPAFASSLAAIINQESGAMGPGVPMPRIADKTGLKGIYDIRLEYAGLPFVLPLLSDPAPAPAASDPVDAGPNIFTALQKQLGLKLTKVADVPVEVMIVDHADRTPTEN